MCKSWSELLSSVGITNDSLLEVVGWKEDSAVDGACTPVLAVLC